MPIQRPPLAPRQKISSVEIYWKAVTYRTVAVYVLLVFAVVMAILYLIYPEAYSGAMTRISQAIGASTVPTAARHIRRRHDIYRAGGHTGHG